MTDLIHVCCVCGRIRTALGSHVLPIEWQAMGLKPIDGSRISHGYCGDCGSKELRIVIESKNKEIKRLRSVAGETAGDWIEQRYWESKGV